MTHEAVVGIVESWDDETGWGLLRTPDGLSVFCHFSKFDVLEYRTLVPGSAVCFDYEVPGQDGCDALVLTAARPALPGDPPAGLQPPTPTPNTAPLAYRSEHSITWDD